MNKKLRTPKLFRFKRNKLHASTAARRRLRIGATADYEELAEPNMKLSRALLIVLLLHVVAVAGIIAFNAIKTRQSSFVNASASLREPLKSENPAAVKSTEQVSSPVGMQKTSAQVTKTGHNAGHPKPVATAKDPTDSGRVYVVVKGDNPVTIAKKFKVSYEDLILLNHIEDPRKLQIGQKLQIPTRQPKSKRGDK
jgi:LysM repeat protein